MRRVSFLVAVIAVLAAGCGAQKVVYVGPRPDPLKSQAMRAVNAWLDAVQAKRWGKACALSSTQVIAELGGTWQCRRLLKLAVHPSNGLQEVVAADGHAHVTADVPARLSIDSVRDGRTMRVKFFVAHTRGDPGACSLLIRQVAGLASVSHATRRDLARNCHYRL